MRTVPRPWLAALATLTAAACLSSSPTRAAGADLIAEARALYAAAAYEDTLALLTAVTDPALADQVDEYRALCLLALNREAEAAQSMEAIVRRHPLRLADMEARSPKFAALYRGVQTRLLPVLAAERYSVAKRTYDAGDYPAAARDFSDVLALLRAAEGARSETAAPLELLAAGFLALAERRVSDASSAPVRSEPEQLAYRGSAGVAARLTDAALEPAPASLLSPEPPWFTPVHRVYSVEDRDVAPPVAIEQKLPAWRPPNEAALAGTFAGRLSILIDVDGRVIDAEILQAANPVYDNQLLRLVAAWRYRPATKRSYPVQYRRVIDYALRPPLSGAR